MNSDHFVQNSVSPANRPLDWAQKLALIGVLLLPILVLFKRVPAEVAVGVTVLIALFVAIRRRDFSWLAQGWVYAAAALSVILLARPLKTGIARRLPTYRQWRAMPRVLAIATRRTRRPPAR